MIETPPSLPEKEQSWMLEEQAEAEPAQEPAASDIHPLLSAMHSLGLPLVLFGGLLSILMAVIMVLMSPDRFPVTMGGKTVPLYQLTNEMNALAVQQKDVSDEQKRFDSLIPTPVLRELTALQTSFAHIGQAMLAVTAVRQSFATASNDPIHFDSIRFDRQSGKLQLTGTVQDASRPIDILASFVDNLRADPAFTVVSEPEYQQQERGDVKVAPFSITLNVAFHA